MAQAQKQPDQYRNKDLARIHIAKKELGMDEATYREMLKAVGGKESAKDLTIVGRRAVIAHLIKSGAKIGKPKKYGKRPNNIGKSNIGRSGMLKKIEALLTVGGRPWEYADALAKRICKVDSITFVPENELYKIITALRVQAKREGWDLSGENGGQDEKRKN
ncbi:regulatory protein GemA [Desulfosarcina sp. OttesenSCG-928-G10]|nr:regulatory protein GemA [Desulfosarcina sp. OttesenSCG-928-G10]MDL2320749.1 regulatory protein GemA [Desulfosarcina sp. OttesenSCG-928-B08]